jgi:hypothetical protein
VGQSSFNVFKVMKGFSMRIAFSVRRSLRFMAAVTAFLALAGWTSPITAHAAAGSLTQIATASVVDSTTLGMSGMASCTGGGTDTIQTVVVSQGLTDGAVGTLSNEFSCDGNMHPWGIKEGVTLGVWAGGSNVTSVVAFSSSVLTTTDMATLTPASGTTFYVVKGGGSVDTTTSYVHGTATCAGGGTKTIHLDYNEYDAGVSASGSTTVACDGALHNWAMFIYADAEWSGDPGMAVGTLQDGNGQTIATYTTPMTFAA